MEEMKIFLPYRGYESSYESYKLDYLYNIQLAITMKLYRYQKCNRNW